MANKNKYDKVLGEYRENDGIRGANATTYFTFDGAAVSLYVNGSLRQKWTTTPVTPSAGNWMGFGLFTYS
jgi:hypothetical protein